MQICGIQWANELMVYSLKIYLPYSLRMLNKCGVTILLRQEHVLGDQKDPRSNPSSVFLAVNSSEFFSLLLPPSFFLDKMKMLQGLQLRFTAHNKDSLTAIALKFYCIDQLYRRA